jgi:hypothetical protein
VDAIVMSTNDPYVLLQSSTSGTNSFVEFEGISEVFRG